MIKANHKYWARLLYDFYIQKLLKANFQNFYVTNEFPNIPENDGLIITPNHFSWWDGFFADYILKHVLNRKVFLLMLEEQLKKYWFFKKVGAFSVNPQNPKSIKLTFDYIVEIISNNKNVLIFYPQGEIEAYDKRPLDVKEGLKSVLNMTDKNVSILPLAFKIKYGNTKKPDVLVRFGNLIQSIEIKENFKPFVDSFNTNVELLDKHFADHYKQNLFRR